MKNNRHISLPSLVPTLLAIGVAWGSIANAQAAATLLADKPITSTSPAHPNIMFTLDNSGSMARRHMPDTVGSWTGNVGYKNAQCNGVYYNPNVSYTPPADYLNTLWANSNFTNASADGYDSTPILRNLSANFRADSESTTSSEPAYYYKFTGVGTPTSTQCQETSSTAFPHSSANFTKVRITSTSGPGATDERPNFANWYSFYRTRLLMAKTAIGHAFAQLDLNTSATNLPQYRVGFNTIADGSSNINTQVTDGTYWLTIRDFNATQKQTWFNKLYATSATSWTPLRYAMEKIGKLYQNTLAGAADPVQYSCQKNYHILSTDGYWNDNGAQYGTAFSGYNNQDGSDSGYSTRAYGALDGLGASNTLADVAMYFYKTDLRPAMADNVPPDTSGKDIAPHQHMTSYTIGFGANGTKPFQSDYETATSGFFYNVKHNTENWPIPVADSASTIDDLWHAAVNGHGSYLSASDPQRLENGLVGFLNDITGAATAAVGPTIPDADFSALINNTVYAVKYKPATWTGDVTAHPINPVTAITDISTTLWSAQVQLTALTAGTGWNTTRKIVTLSDSIIPPAAPGIPFRWANLSSNQKTNLSNDSDLLNFLRGDITYEGAAGTSGKKFRDRTDPTDSVHRVLGDIINSRATIVSPPRKKYDDVNDPGYTAFKSSNATRPTTLYVGANDGMVHAFDATTGNENWAYVPSKLVRPCVAVSNGADCLAALSYQNSGTPAFRHHNYVDASPRQADVDFSNTYGAGGSPDWHTILVGGLGKGGMGYYALDVTNPSSVTNESTAASKVLWEFPNPNDPSHASALNQVGYSYGRPITTKTYKYGWVVIVASGYNNADGLGHVFVLNAKTGALLHTFNTSSGSSSSPSGLAKIAGYTISYNNDFVEQVYGGDLNGNVWRFDLNPTPGTPGAIWPTSAELLASFPSTQAFTSEPTIGVDSTNSVRWIFLGSGKYLDSTDVSNANIQSMYAIKDGSKTAPIRPASTITRSNLTQITGVSGANVLNSGWYIDFPAQERILIDPAAALGVILFATMTPTSDPCSPGFSGNAYAFKYGNGKSVLKQNGIVVQSVFSANGFVSANIVRTTSGVVAGVPVSAKTTGVLSTPTGTPVTVNLDDGTTASTKRVSWHEILN